VAEGTDALRAEVLTTRSELAHAVNDVAERLSPRAVASRAGHRLATPAIAIAATAAAVVLIVLWRD
jgi:Protein of unknown function (DUF3618)